jgi:hypothetical protein
VRSRPRDLAPDSENRLQSARGRARARRRRGWRSRGARNLRAARARLAAPPSAALWRSESVWRPIRGARGSRIGTRASASRLIDLTLAPPRDPELCRRPLQQTRSGVGAGILRSASASPVCAESWHLSTSAFVISAAMKRAIASATFRSPRSKPRVPTEGSAPERPNGLLRRQLGRFCTSARSPGFGAGRDPRVGQVVGLPRSPLGDCERDPRRG